MAGLRTQTSDRVPGAAARPTLHDRLARTKESFGHLVRTLALVWKTSPTQAVALGVSTVLGALLPIAIAWVGKRIVDGVVARDSSLTLRFVGVEVVLVVVVGAVLRVQSLVRSLLGSRLGHDVNVAILQKAASFELPQFEDPEFYDRLTRARREASHRPVAMASDGFALVQSVLQLAGFVALLAVLEPLVVAVLVLASLPATVAEMRFSTEAFRLKNRRSAESRQLSYLEYVLANDQHVKEVKLFGLGNLLLDRYKTLGERFYVEDRALSIRRAFWGWLLTLASTAAFYGAYAWMAADAARGDLTLGELTLYVAAFRQGQAAFQGALAALQGMYDHTLYMSNLWAFLEAEPAAPAPLLPAPVATGGEKGLRFEDVGFRYPGSERWAVRHLDLFVPAGGSLALVGRNGAGKTTLVKLLARLYEPTEGRVLLDGVDLRTLDKEALRKRIGVVFQDFNRYHLAARENVGFGDVDRLGDDAALERALEKSGADEVVSGLKGGLEQQLGRWFGDGVELSGGQWQKLAMARGFIREGADLLVLDEPTAALDAEAEAAVFERFQALSAGRTTLLVSHRFSSVRRADRIVVLDGGRITESGTHEELLARDGDYAHLFRLQAAGYA